MKITKLQIVTGLLITMVFSFMVGVFFSLDTLSNYSRAFILPFLVYLYLTESENKSRYFAVFLTSCAVGEFLKVFIDFDTLLMPKISNIAYIFGYLNLLAYMAKSINLTKLLSEFKVPIIVLIIFNGYLIFVLNQMILADKTIDVYTLNFLIESTYDICILLVLSFSLINYLYHDSKRSLILFLASVCIVFSEMVKVAYLFVSSNYMINVTYSILIVVGFYLVYVYIVSKINRFYKVLF